MVKLRERDARRLFSGKKARSLSGLPVLSSRSLEADGVRREGDANSSTFVYELVGELGWLSRCCYRSYIWGVLILRRDMGWFV